VGAAAARAAGASPPPQDAKLGGMDEGLPIAYPLLEKDVPVYAAGGELVGTVHHVVAAPDQDIFHGIVVAVGKERRFILAEQIESLHEHGVDLKIDDAQASALPAPHGGAPVFRDVEPGAKPSGWKHFVDRAGGHAGRDGWKKQ
jgi:hypothetical protein